jgi:ribose-phosphate pyrophosphokinase
MANPVWIYGPESHAALISELASALGLARGGAAIGRFADGERRVEIRDDVMGCPAILLISTGPPVDSHVMTLALMADAVRRAGAGPVIGIVPYFGYARAERMAAPGSPIGCRVVADLVQGAGLSHLITFDLHNPAIAGFFTIPVLEQSALDPIARCFTGVSPERHVVVAPDAGAIKRVSHLATLLGLPMAIAVKHRLGPDEPKVLQLWGEFKGREAIVFDDMVATGSTIEQVANLLWQRGIAAIEVAAVHPVMAGEAERLLKSLGIRRFITTDTIPFQPTAAWPGFEVVSIAPVLIQTLKRGLGRLLAGE